MDRRKYLFAIAGFGAIAGCLTADEQSSDDGLESEPDGDDEPESNDDPESDSEPDSEKGSDDEEEVDTEPESESKPEFSITEIETPESEVTQGDRVTVTVQMENVGTGSGETTLEFSGSGVDLHEDVEIEEGESVSTTFTFDASQVGSFEFSINEPVTGESATGTIEVVTPPAEFELDNFSVEPSEVPANESVNVSVDVENIGGERGTHQVDALIDGDEWESIEVELAPDESTTVEFSLTFEEPGTSEIEVGPFHETIHKWNEIGIPYEAPDGLSVTLDSFDIVEKPGSYQYEITYTLENKTDNAIDEGSFKLYDESGSEGLPQYGSFGRLFPEDTLTRSYVFEEESDIHFNTLAYHHDQFFADFPPEDSLKWPVEY